MDEINKNNYVVKAHNISLDIRGVKLLENISLECFPFQWTLIQGESGSGKSTLLRVLNGLTPPTKGVVEILGSVHPRRTRSEAIHIWKQCGTVLQESALFDTKSVIENIMLPLSVQGIRKKKMIEIARYWLKELDIENKANNFPSSLSGGQSQRVSLARAFAVKPKILFLDEPTSSLDSKMSIKVLEIIKSFSKKGSSIIMSSHKISEVMGFCNQTINISKGQIQSKIVS